MKRSVLFEAMVVGLLNLLMFISIRALLPKIHIFTQIIMSGVALHLLFEYSPLGNINEKWCRSTFP